MESGRGLAQYPVRNMRGLPAMQQRRRIYTTLSLWSEKRRASAEAAAVVLESFEASVRATGAASKPQDVTEGGQRRRSGSERDAA